jgi:hypothetical protein
MNKKIVFNYRLAQDTPKDKKDSKSKIVPQPASDLPPILSIEGEQEVFNKLENEAKRYVAQSGSNARSDFFSNPEISFQFTQLNNLHKRIIENMLPGKSSGSSAGSSANESGTSSSGYNNSKNEAKAYEPYLQKINDSQNGNNLLYLAAISSFGFPSEKGKNVDYFYTQENKDKIVKRLNDITSNHYIQTKFPNIPNQLPDAIERLESKISKGASSTDSGGVSSSSSSSAANDTVPAPGTGNPVNNPYPKPEIGVKPAEQPTTFGADKDNFSNEARTILREIEDLEKIANSDEDKFKQQWPKLYKLILNELDTARNDNKINIPEESDIRTKLTNLDNKYYGIFYPGGFKRLSNGTIIPKDVKEAAAELLEQLKSNKDSEEVNKLAKIFQKAFLDKQSSQSPELSGYLAEINTAINTRNSDTNFDGFVPKISMSEFI